jgi:K+ transporter
MLPGLVLNYFGQRGSWGCWRRDRTLLVVVRTADIPDVPDEDRAEVCRLEPAVHQVILTFGFMEEPDVPQALSRVEINRVLLDPAEISYFTGRELAIQGDAEGMYPLLEHLFVLLSRRQRQQVLQAAARAGLRGRYPRRDLTEPGCPSARPGLRRNPGAPCCVPAAW